MIPFQALVVIIPMYTTTTKNELAVYSKSILIYFENSTIIDTINNVSFNATGFKYSL